MASASDNFKASTSRKRKLEPSILLRTLDCSDCSKLISEVEATSNLTVKCIECLKTDTTSRDGGFPFEMTEEHLNEQLKKDFQCPICLLIIRDTTELPCGHIMCANCLVKSENVRTSVYELNLFI